MDQNSKLKYKNIKQKTYIGIITIILMVFGALVLIFSLFYFGRYAKKNFNKMILENEHHHKESINENPLNESSELEVALTSGSTQDQCNGIY